MIGLRQVGEAGREFTIMRDGKAVAKVALAVAEKPRRKPGGLKGMFTLPDRFFDPLPDDEVAAWEGNICPIRAMRLLLDTHAGLVVSRRSALPERVRLLV